MFSKETYISRRQELKKLVKSGVIILFGNNNSPCNFPNNGYYPFRQDSTFLYYFGLQRDGLVGVIDIDNDIETLIGDDIDLVDIVWYGSVDSVHDLAAQVGVHNSAPMKRSRLSATTPCRRSARFISCHLTATTSNCRYSTFWASILTSRKKRPAWTSSRLL